MAGKWLRVVTGLLKTAADAGLAFWGPGSPAKVTRHCQRKKQLLDLVEGRDRTGRARRNRT